MTEVRFTRIAYRAGMMAAWNPANTLEIPIRYSSEPAASAYIDGFMQERAAMANKVATPNVKLTLLPHDPAKGDGVVVKAADCVG